MTCHALAVAILLCGIAANGNGGDAPTPRPVAPSPLVQNENVKLLLSKTPQTRRRAKELILKEAKQQPRQWRDGIASELAIIVATPEHQRDRPESVRAAIELLGELRSRTGIGVLARYIGFPFVYYPGIGRSPKSVGIPAARLVGCPLDKSLPATSALINIGDSSADVLIEKLQTTDRVLEQKACLFVLKAFDSRSEIRAKLKNAMIKAAPHRRFALQSALNALEGKPIYSKTVQSLLSRDRIVRTRRNPDGSITVQSLLTKELAKGGKARPHVKHDLLNKWKQIEFKGRKQIISELSRIVADPENHVFRPEAVREAIQLLGELRSLEGIDVLVEYIGFPKVRHPDAGEYEGPTPRGGKPVPKGTPGAAERRAKQFPAVPALINIGPPCIDAVIAKFANTDSMIEHELLTDVLKGIDDDSIKKKLDEAIPKALPPRRDALRKALAALEEVFAE